MRLLKIIMLSFLGERTKYEYLGCYERQRYFNLLVPLSKINRNPETCVNICFTRGKYMKLLFEPLHEKTNVLVSDLV